MNHKKSLLDSPVKRKILKKTTSNIDIPHSQKQQLFKSYAAPL